MKKISKTRIRFTSVSAARWFMLMIVGSVILFPILSLFAASVKDVYGLVDPMVKWIPREMHFENFSKAFEAVGGASALVTSLLLYGTVMLCQLCSSLVIAYGFARYGFKGRNIIFALMIATFFVPQQVVMLPRYVLFSKYGMLGTVWTVVLPSLCGQGLRQVLLILIFWQFMKTIPVSLEEAAMIDGATLPGIFFRIGVPLAAPGIVISSVLSFAWNWNDTFFANSYFNNKITTMTISLSKIRNWYSSQSGNYASYGGGEKFHQGVEAAGAVLVILPLLIVYLLLQKKLIESVDRAGITGE